MTLTQLRYFQAVCNYGGANRAAEQMNVSQPSISNGIRDLEREFNLMLFVRKNKQLILTSEGKRFLELTNQLLAKADDTLEEMRSLEKNKPLRVGIPPMLCSFILPILYNQVLTDLPEVPIKVVEDDRSGLLLMFEKDQIDLAFFPHNQAVDSAFSSVAITEMQNVCCVNKKHPLAKKKSLSIFDLKDEEFVFFKSSFFQTQRILDRFSKAFLTPKILLETSQVSTVQNVVAGTNGVGIIFDFLLDSSPQLVRIPLDPPMYTSISLIWKNTGHLQNHAAKFIHYFRKLYA